PRVRSQKHADGVLLLCDLPLERGDRRKAPLEVRLGARRRDPSVRATGVPLPEHVQRPPVRLRALARDGELAIELEELKVPVRDVTHERYDDAPARLVVREVLRLRRFRGPADAPPEVDLPRNVEGPEEHVE